MKQRFQRFQRWRWRFRGLIPCVPPRSQRQSIGCRAPDRSVRPPPRYAWPFARNRVGPLQHTSSRWRRTRGRAPSMLDVQDSFVHDTRRHWCTCSRCLTLRGEGTRRVTTIPEISPLAQSFVSAVRLQCSDLTRSTSAIRTLYPCAKYSIFSDWVSSRTISVAHFHVNINHRTALRVWRCGAALVATLLDAYSRIEALCCSTGLMFESMGMRTNSHENRSDL